MKLIPPRVKGRGKDDGGERGHRAAVVVNNANAIIAPGATFLPPLAEEEEEEEEEDGGCDECCDGDETTSDVTMPSASDDVPRTSTSPLSPSTTWTTTTTTTRSRGGRGPSTPSIANDSKDEILVRRRGGIRRRPSFSSSSGAASSVDHGGSGSGRGSSSSMRRRMKILLHRNVKSPEERIAEARERVSKMLIPDPFDNGERNRLEELREAKRRAVSASLFSSSSSSSSSSLGMSSASTSKDRVDIGRRDSDRTHHRGRGASTVISSASTAPPGISSSRGTSSIEACDRESVGGDRGLGGNATTGGMKTTTTTETTPGCRVLVPPVVCLLILDALRCGGRWDRPIPVALVLVLLSLQTIALRSLLYSALIYSFDNVDLGGKVNLAKNMEIGRRMFVSKVRRYATVVSAIVAFASCVFALYGGWIAQEEEGGGGGGVVWGGEISERFDVRACECSARASSRLGVFVVSFLLLCRASFVRPAHTTRSG